MRYTVTLAHSAKTNVAKRLRYLSREAPDQTHRWYDGLIEALRSLTEMPHRCPVVMRDEKTGRETRQLLYEDHCILFSIRGAEVRVGHIRHVKRKFPPGPPSSGDI